MDLTGSPFRLLLLAVDMLIVSTAFFGAWTMGRRGARWALLGALLSLTAWSGPALLMADIRGFALLARVAWTTVTVSLPLFLLIHAASSRRALWLAPAALLAAFKFYGEVWEQSRLEVSTADIPVAGLKAPLKVAHFSDLQTDGIRGLERRARERANAFQPDLVVFTGDVMNHPSLAAPVYAYLAGYEAKLGKFFVGGDVDGALDPQEFTARTGFTWLDGRTVTLRTAGGRLALVGFGLLDYRLGSDYGFMRGRQAKGADAAVALSHRPDAAFILEGTPVRVLFTGHTHGGQVALPWFGPLVTLTRMPREIAWGGVHRFRGLTVALARGYGREGHFAPRVRLFCRPQLLLVRLVPEKLSSPHEMAAGRADAPGPLAGRARP